jgi:RimJ/RimL family protein N-acetyltransferase
MHDAFTIGVIPALRASEEPGILDMIVAASSDPTLCDATYLPAGFNLLDAADWLAARGPLAWVLTCNGTPCGWYELGVLKGSIGLELPKGTLEREVWLLPTWRGQGVVREATTFLTPGMQLAGVRHVLGVAWESNVAAIKGMEHAGFTRLGRVWWEHTAYEPGWCDAWMLNVSLSEDSR